MKFAVLAVLTASLLAGCANPPPQIAHLDPQVAAVQRTDDPAEQRRRFGFYADVVGKYFVGTFAGMPIFVHYKQWLVPGASLAFEQTLCNNATNCSTTEYIAQWNSETRNLHIGSYFESAVGKSLHWSDRTRRVRDGIVYIGDTTPLRFDAATGEIESFTLPGYLKYVEATPERYAEAVGKAMGDARHARREERRESAAMWSAVASGLQAAAQDQSVVNQRRAQLESAATNALQSAPPSASRPSPQQQTPQSVPRPSAASNAAPPGTPGVQVASNANRSLSATPPAAKPLQFRLHVAMEPGPKATANPQCYSNVVTLPAPPGYGVSAPGFSDRPAREQALATIRSYHSSFIAKCNAATLADVRLPVRNAVVGHRWNADAGESFPPPRGANDVVVEIQ